MDWGLLRVFGSSWSFKFISSKGWDGIEVIDYAKYRATYFEGLGEWDSRTMAVLAGWSNGWFIIGLGGGVKLC